MLWKVKEDDPDSEQAGLNTLLHETFVILTAQRALPFPPNQDF